MRYMLDSPSVSLSSDPYFSGKQKIFPPTILTTNCAQTASHDPYAPGLGKSGTSAINGLYHTCHISGEKSLSLGPVRSYHPETALHIHPGYSQPKMPKALGLTPFYPDPPWARSLCAHLIEMDISVAWICDKSIICISEIPYSQRYRT